MPDSVERRLLHAVRVHAIEERLPMAAWTAGLGHSEFDALASAVGACDPEPGPPCSLPIRQRPVLLTPLVELLWSNRECDDAWTRLISGAVACAAYGSRHLWQDLGLDGRHEVTALFERRFPRVVSSNERQLKWKHHLFNLLGSELKVPGLRPPNCGDCEQLPVCFPDRPRASGSEKEVDGTQAKQESATRGQGLTVDHRGR